MKNEEFDGIKINKDAIAAGYRVWDLIVKNESLTFATYEFISECTEYGIQLSDICDIKTLSHGKKYAVISENGLKIKTSFNNDAPRVFVLNVTASEMKELFEKAKERNKTDFKVVGY